MSVGRSRPWLCFGDFNEILHQSEKKGKKQRCQRQIQLFREAIEDAQLSDLGYNGATYTWCNGRKGTEGIWERLDRGFANKEWRETYPNAGVTHETISHSDHSPITISLSGNTDRRGSIKQKMRPFIFETFWIQDSDYENVLRKSWNLVLNEGERDIRNSLFGVQ